MKIYTKTGDDGTTGLFGGTRVQKHSPRVDAYGTVDETNATLGVARATGLDPDADTLLSEVQGALFTLGAELSTAPGKEKNLKMRLVSDGDIALLEQGIDRTETTLPPLKNFVLPGGTPQSAALHLARTVCRRAERAVLGLSDPAPRREVVVYLNRLSDLLFVLARRENHRQDVADVPWNPREGGA